VKHERLLRESKYHDKPEYRLKCRALLLNRAGIAIKQVALHLDLHHITIGNWLTAWEKYKLVEWEAADLYLFYLPTYSPHLNPVEILWRFCKYKWLNNPHHKSWSTLKKAILAVFRDFGSVYCINFDKLIFKNSVSNKS